MTPCNNHRLDMLQSLATQVTITTVICIWNWQLFSISNFKIGIYVTVTWLSKHGFLAALINSKMSPGLALRYVWQYLLNIAAYKSTLLLKASIPKQMNPPSLKYKHTTLDNTVRKKESRQNSGWFRCLSTVGRRVQNKYAKRKYLNSTSSLAMKQSYKYINTSV